MPRLTGELLVVVVGDTTQAACGVWGGLERRVDPDQMVLIGVENWIMWVSIHANLGTGGILSSSGTFPATGRCAGAEDGEAWASPFPVKELLNTAIPLYISNFYVRQLHAYLRHVLVYFGAVWLRYQHEKKYIEKTL